MKCRKCGKAVVRGPLGFWAHVVNPKQFHHYVIAVPA